MSQLKRLYDAQDWDALADCLAVHTQAIVARGGRGYSQLHKLSPEDLQNAATDVAIYHLEDPKHWRALVSSCGGSNDPEKEAKSVERYVATAMWRAFAKAVTPASHNVMHRYIRDAILSDESGPFKSDGPVYGLAGWTDAETMGVYKGVWSEFANPDAAKTFAQFGPYLRVAKEGKHISGGYTKNDISDGCQRLFGLIVQFATAPTVSRGIFKSNWFTLPNLRTSGLDPHALMDGLQADEVSQEKSNHLRAPDTQFESSPNYIEALFETWYGSLAPELQTVVRVHQIVVMMAMRPRICSVLPSHFRCA